MELKSHPNKLLFEHLKDVGNKSVEILKNKKLNLELLACDKILNLSFVIGVCHDFGKATRFFQKKLNTCQNVKFSNHGLISALFGFVLVREIMQCDLCAIIAYTVIKKHHGNLVSPLDDNLSNFKKELEKQLESLSEKDRYSEIEVIYNSLLNNFSFDFPTCFKKFSNLIKDKLEDFIDDNIFDIILPFEDDTDEIGIERFLITNLLYSVLIDVDKNDAAGVSQQHFKDNLNAKISVKSYLDKLKLKTSSKYDVSKEINIIRNLFFNEVRENENISVDNYLYSLTAPTGVGKTFASYEFACILKDKFINGRRIIYCLPYTSIIDQNHLEIENIIRFNLKENYEGKPTKYLMKHHHLTPLRIENYYNNNEEGYLNYFEQKLVLESWGSANIITTFIQLFHSIVGYKNSFLKKFHNIINSIIILDEIQTLPVDYYMVVGKVFKILATKFNTYILFLTATQPKIVNTNSIVELVKTKEYAINEIFNRVKLKVLNIDEALDVDNFINFFKEDFKSRTGLIVCNKIKTAIRIFNLVVDYFQPKNFIVFSLTTNIIPLQRIDRIKNIKAAIKENKKVLVISTQLIEAGVDFSFEKVYRDLAPLDSIIQTAGRCNRNNEMSPQKGEMILFNLNDENSIYDIELINMTKKILDKKEYESREFIDISNCYFSLIDKKRESTKLLKAIKMLNYNLDNSEFGNPIKNFELIREKAKEDVIIVLDNDIKKIIQQLEKLLSQSKEIDKKHSDFENDIEKIELLKKEIGKYRISIYNNRLQPYENIIKEISGIKYIDCLANTDVYNPQTGFIYPSFNG